MSRTNKFLCALYVLFLIVATAICCLANAQPSELTPQELGIVDAIIAFVVAKWPEIGTALYGLAFARALIPRKISEKSGIQWLFWIWDRIAMNWGGARNKR